MLTAKLIDSVAAEDLTGAAECLEKGANPNALSGDGATAMHIAAGIGVDAVRLMLTYCGDPNIRSVDGSTPLHVAAAWGDRDTLRLLLHNGADPNLMDHEGQRAVDVAKSERHAACVDFLKYYTMLVTVGDEEEGQMYTSELLDPSQGGVACGSDRDSPSPHGCHIQSPHYLPHFSSDDEDPANLSDQYSDALSRRLSRLLNDGKGACLDVTSPDCPYIGTKQDRNRGGGDRTLVADDTCTLLPHLVDSDTSEMDLAVSEGQSSCRCRSNHCCSHNPAKQSDLGARQKTPVFCDQHHLDCPGLPECRDSQAVYARDLEKKMKQRYFPGLGEDLRVSDRGTGRHDQNRSADNVSKYCSHYYFESLSPQSASHVGENTAGIVSTHALSSPCCKGPKSWQGNISMCKEPDYQRVVDHSPPVSDPFRSSPCSCSFHAQKQPRSPNTAERHLGRREQYSSLCQKPQHFLPRDSRHHRHAPQKQPRSRPSDELQYTQRSFHSSERRPLQSEHHTPPCHGETSHHCASSQQTLCCSDVCRSPVFHRNDPPVPSSHHGLHRSPSDLSRQGRPNEGHLLSAVSKSLRKQTTHPPSERSSVCGSGNRSPVTILHVQCEHSSPSPSMFRRGAHFPFTLSSPKREKTEFTTISGICKKDIPVAGSCSAVSVDSGFCEKCTTEQKLGADILRCEPKFLGSKQQEHTSPLLHGKKTAGATMRQMPDKENGEKGSERPFHFDGYKFSRGEDTKNLPFEDGCKIVSSNLGGRKCVLDLSTLPHHEPADCEGQGWPRRKLNKEGEGQVRARRNFTEEGEGQGRPTWNFTEKGEGQGRPTWNFTEEGEGQVRAGRKFTDEGEMMTRREASRQEVLADVSESSCDSFQTCEEASLQDTAVDAKSEHRSHRRKSQQHSDNLPPDNRKQSTRTVEAGVKEQEKASFCTPDRDTELHFQMQSLGFTVSEAGGNQHNHSSSTKRKGHTQASYLIRDSHGKEKVDPKETDTAGQRSIGKDKSDPGQTDTAGQRGVTMLKGHHQSLVSHHKSWLPPSGLLLDDSDLLTSDGSFMATAPGQQTNNQLHSLHSSNVSRWLQSVPTATLPSKPQDAKQRRNRASKRVSDESLMSVASSVQEYIYRDKENGIALIERHIPSDFSGSSGRPSLETEGGLDTDATVSYDWTDFSINSGDVSSSSSSSFDITAGQTMRSQETLKGSDSNGCGEECSSTSDDCQEDSGDGRRQGDKENDDGNRQEDKENDDGNRQVDQENEKNTKEKRNKGDKPQKIAESGGKKTNTKSLDADSQQTEDSSQADSPVSSDHAAISPELASLSNLAIYQSLKAFGEDPGPVIQSTRQTYLQLLADLHNGKRRLGLTSSQPGYSSELNRLLSGSVDVEDLAKAELSMVAPFQTPDGRAWREGTIKSCFNYLLLDPRVTKNLPLRAKSLSDLDAFKIFLSAVFYIGKGKRSRPYCHLYEAISQQKSPKQKVSQKVQVILEVWAAGLGVVSLHCFQNVIPVEAYTREACMVDAIGLGRLTNVKRGDYYGVASTWPTARRQSMGAYLLRKAFQIFLSEGERQICPLDIQKGK